MQLKKLAAALSGPFSDDALGALVAHMQRETVMDAEIAYLAECLAQSGTCLELQGKGLTADIASTGGPTSLSTLVCPLYLCALGCVVPKLGVPGRPAGGIDVLAQVPGFRFRLSGEEVEDALCRSRYVHFLASDDFAPLDAVLFAFRQRTGRLAVPSLVIASILSKKIAADVRLAGLDVRVAPHCNFGTNWDNARHNAEQFCRVARLLRRTGLCVLTDARRPLQPFVGRGESLVALSQCLRYEPPSEWLSGHVDACYAIVRALLASSIVHTNSTRPTVSDLRRVFSAQLAAQGTTMSCFHERVAAVADAPREGIMATREGFLEIDLHRLRTEIVCLQERTRSGDDPFPDPFGVVLLKQPSSFVYKGDLLAYVRSRLHDPREIAPRVQEALAIKPLPVGHASLEVISHG